jgi:hypothetical protein
MILSLSTAKIDKSLPSGYTREFLPDGRGCISGRGLPTEHRLGRNLSRAGAARAAREVTRMTTITPTEFEKAEWSRCAAAQYARGNNLAGHTLSVAAAVRRGEAITTDRYDACMTLYRAWLVGVNWRKS